MKSLVIDTYKDINTHTLINPTSVPTNKEKKIVLDILKYIVNTSDKNLDKELSRVISKSTSYDALINSIEDCYSIECLLANAILTYHITPKSLLMITTAVHGRVKKLDTSSTWYDNFTLNSYLYQLDTIVFNGDSNEDDNDPITRTVNSKCIINSNVIIPDDVSRNLLYHLGNSYRVYETLHKSLDEVSNEDSLEALDKIAMKYPYFSGGAHGCDVFWIPSKSVDLDSIRVFCKRYPNNTIGYILNTSSYASGKGQHWVSMLFKGNYCYMICSFGSDYNVFDCSEQINNTLNSLGFGKLYNEQMKIQEDSSSCGMYSVLSTLAFLIEAYKDSNKTLTNKPIDVSKVVSRIGSNAETINIHGIDSIKSLLTGFK